MGKDFSEKIKRLRIEKGMTLEQVASVVGVGKSTVRKWETGMIENMGRDKIEKLAKALRVTPEYLMGWEEEKPAETSELSEKQKKVVQMIMEIPEERLDWVYSVLQTILAGGQ